MIEKLAQDLSEIISRGSDNLLPVIVQLNTSISDTDENIIKEAGGSVKRKLHIINSYATELTVDAIKALVDNPRIKKIYYDGEISIV